MKQRQTYRSVEVWGIFFVLQCTTNCAPKTDEWYFPQSSRLKKVGESVINFYNILIYSSDSASSTHWFRWASPSFIRTRTLYIQSLKQHPSSHSWVSLSWQFCDCLLHCYLVCLAVQATGPNNIRFRPPVWFSLWTVLHLTLLHILSPVRWKAIIRH